MSATLPAFQLASTLGPSTDEREEFAAKIRSKDAELEELREAKRSGAMKPQERQALVQLLSDMSRKIEDLTKALKEAQNDIEWIQESIPKLIAEDRKRIADLENGPDISKSDAAKAHVNELYKHMKTIGRKQVSFKEASRCLNLSKSRVQQFKVIIALDTRFLIVKSESHSQKELIRLRED
jgi:seryl-tRNA synthetase